MKKILSVISILLVFILPSQAQHILKGVIVDESNTTIPAVTVRILNTDSTFIAGSVTDDHGLFRFENVEAGNYILAISCIGYTNLFLNMEMPQTSYDLPTIALKEDNVTLDAVTVIGSSFIQKKDHLLVIPDKQQIKHAFSGYDLLYNLMIPGLTIDKKKKTVTSMAGEATLYINGVKADMREVQALQPKDIERIEYYTLPTHGQFMGDAASINYITKVYQTGGYITVDGEQTIGYTKGDYNVAAKVAHGNTNYTFFGGYNTQKYDGVEVKKNEELLFSDNTVHRQTMNSGAKYKGNQQYAQFKISNDTKKRNLSAQASFVRDDMPEDSQNGLLTYAENETQTVRSFDRNASENMRGDINLNGLFNVSPHRQWKLRVNGSYNKNAYDRTYAENERTSQTHVSENLYSFDAQIAYRHEFDRSNSLYSRITHFHNTSSTSYSGDYTSWQHLWKGESLLQVDYTHMFGEKTMMMLSPGLSWMNYKLHGNDLVSCWNVRVNGWVRHVINSKQWVGAGFSAGNNQPDISYLNTSNQTIDFYQVKRGNPYLDNTSLYQCFAMYEGQFHRLFNLQLKLWYTKDVHNTYAYYFLEKDKIISTYASDDSYDTANTEMSVTSRISDNLRINAGFKYQYMYVPDKSDVLSQHNIVGSVDVNYFIKSFAINAYARSTEKILDQTSRVYMKSPASYGLSVRYSSKNWMAEVGTNNPFTKHLYYREYADYGVYRYNQEQTSRIYQQTAYIKLAYTFDFGKKTSRENNNVDRSINSAILKAR